MTGISRKEIRKIRDRVGDYRWTPAMEISPANLLLHYWHFDADFFDKPGVPRPLMIQGETGFSGLARRYVGDIPWGAIKEELRRADVIEETDGLLTVKKRYFQPMEFDIDFIRNISFSITNLASTVVHNANLVSRKDLTQEVNDRERRFERFAWSDQLGPESREAFRAWVRQYGARFIEEADHWIGENEPSRSLWSKRGERSIGVGIYFFEED